MTASDPSTNQRAPIAAVRAFECRDCPVCARDDAHPVQVDLGEPPERVAAMREPVPERAPSTRACRRSLIHRLAATSARSAASASSRLSTSIARRPDAVSTSSALAAPPSARRRHATPGETARQRRRPRRAPRRGNRACVHDSVRAAGGCDCTDCRADRRGRRGWVQPAARSAMASTARIPPARACRRRRPGASARCRP